MGMYRSALTTTFGALLVVALVCAGLALAASHGAARQLQHTRLAHDVLELHLELDALAYALFEELTDEAGEVEAKRLIDAQFRRVRAGIAAKAAFVGSAEDESDELDRLTLIEQRLRRVLDRLDPSSAGGPPQGARIPIEDLLRREVDAGFSQLIEEAVAEERREVVEAEVRANVWLRRVDLLSKLAALGAVVDRDRLAARPSPAAGPAPARAVPSGRSRGARRSQPSGSGLGA